MMNQFSLVGRAGFEPATNGLKVLSASHARATFTARVEAHGAHDAAVFASAVPKSPNLLLDIHPVLAVQSPLSNDETRATISQPLTHAFPALQWVPGSHRGNAAVSGFFVLPSGRGSAQRMGRCRGRTHVPMALYETRRQRPFSRDRNEQATQNHAGLVHHTDAWKLNADAQRAVALMQYEGGREAHGKPRGSLFFRSVRRL